MDTLLSYLPHIVLSSIVFDIFMILCIRFKIDIKFILYTIWYYLTKKSYHKQHEHLYFILNDIKILYFISPHFLICISYIVYFDNMKLIRFLRVP